MTAGNVAAAQVVFIRHGQTRWNEEGRIQGRTDTSLSPAGCAAVKCWAVPPEFRAFDWVTSPLRRARVTAQLLGFPDCPTDPRLAEADWGEWEGIVLTELRRDLGKALQRNEARGLDLSPPGGESPRQVRGRLADWLREIGVAGRSTVAVSHNGVIRAAYSLATGWDMTTEPEIRRGHDYAHHYAVDAAGRLSVRRLNIRLGPEPAP